MKTSNDSGALVEQLRDNWESWGSPTDREHCINETCMAMDCKEAADEIERLRRFERAWAALAARAPALGRTLDVMAALEKEFEL